MATAAKQSEKDVMLPAQVYGVSGRYANALYISASKANQLEKVAEEMQTFMHAYDNDVKLKRYVKDPSVARNTKADTMIAIMEKNSAVTKQFFGRKRINPVLRANNDRRCSFILLMNASTAVILLMRLELGEMHF
jgi:hypothetical protein